MRTSLRLGAAVILAVILAVIAVACSDSGSSPSTTSSGTITVPDTQGADTTVSSTVSTESPSTTIYQGPVYPLTGLPARDLAAAARPALVVKIDNNALARPQSGLNEADIVFEEIVEVQTRFAAVFHSKGADPVGPIRSGRTQDIALLGSFNKPLFAWSGGNPNVTSAIQASDLVSINNVNPQAQQKGGFLRSNDRKAPHNLYAPTSKLWTFAAPNAGPPPQQFSYLADGVVPQGIPSPGVRGDMFGLAIDWKFDSATGLYSRTSAGVIDRDALSGPVTTDNVIIMSVIYRPSGADARSPEAQTVGSGDVMVFTRGVVTQGRWTRKNRLAPILLTDATGSPIELAAGRSWVELASPGKFSPMP